MPLLVLVWKPLVDFLLPVRSESIPNRLVGSETFPTEYYYIVHSLRHKSERV